MWDAFTMKRSLIAAEEVRDMFSIFAQLALRRVPFTISTLANRTATTRSDSSQRHTGLFS